MANKTRTRGTRRSGQMEPLKNEQVGTVTASQQPERQPSYEESLLMELEEYGTVLGHDGLYIKVPSPFGIGLVKDSRPIEKIEPTLVPSGIRIPGEIYEATRVFFKEIYEEMKTECVVLFYYNEQTSEWQVVVPFQTVSGGQAKYNLDAGPCVNLITGEVADIDNTKGWKLYGSAHSHCMMGAFWSQGDNENELPINGIHVTFGKVVENPPELKCSIVLRRTRFVLQPHEVFDIPEVVRHKLPKSVTDRVTKESTVVTTTQTTRYGYQTPTSGYQSPTTGYQSPTNPNTGGAGASTANTPAAASAPKKKSLGEQLILEQIRANKAAAGEAEDLGSGDIDRLQSAYPELFQGSEPEGVVNELSDADIEALNRLERQDAGVDGETAWNQFAKNFK